MKALCSVKDLRFFYSYGDEVLKGINLEIFEGEVVGLLGPNGSGKTTFLKCMAGILDYAGGIFINGKEIRKCGNLERAELVSYLPQFFSVPYGYLVKDIVMFGMYADIKRKNFSYDYAEKMVERVLEYVDLSGKKNFEFNHLSGGEKQRVFLAQVLAQNSKVKIFDEPVSHLDIKHKIHFLGLLSKNIARDNLCSLIVFHDVNLASFVCNRIFLLKDGFIYADGHPADVITKENIKEVYGVDAEISFFKGKPFVLLAMR